MIVNPRYFQDDEFECEILKCTRYYFEVQYHLWFWKDFIDKTKSQLSSMIIIWHNIQIRNTKSMWRRTYSYAPYGPKHMVHRLWNLRQRSLSKTSRKSARSLEMAKESRIYSFIHVTCHTISQLARQPNRFWNFSAAKLFFHKQTRQPGKSWHFAGPVNQTVT